MHQEDGYVHAMSMWLKCRKALCRGALWEDDLFVQKLGRQLEWCEDMANQKAAV